MAGMTLVALSDAWEKWGIIAEIAAAAVGAVALVFVAFGYFHERKRTDEARADAAESRDLTVRALDAAEQERKLTASALELSQRRAAMEFNADVTVICQPRPNGTFADKSRFVGSVKNLGPARAVNVSIQPADPAYIYVCTLNDAGLKSYPNLNGGRTPYITAGATAPRLIDLLPDRDDPTISSVVVTWTDGNGDRTEAFTVALA